MLQVLLVQDILNLCDLISSLISCRYNESPSVRSSRRCNVSYRCVYELIMYEPVFVHGCANFEG